MPARCGWEKIRIREFEMKKLTFVLIGICLLIPACAQQALAESPRIVVLPFPQKMNVSARRIPLDGPVCVVNLASGEVVDYAIERLRRDLKERMSLDVKTGEGARSGARLIIKLKIKPSRPEGYVITSSTSKNTLVWTVAGNDPNGVLYGTFTVRQLIENASAAAGKAVVPADVSVEDWPTMKTRLLPSEIYSISDDDPKRQEKINRLEWSSFWRFNAFWRSAKAPRENIAYIARLGKRRGMTLYGIDGFYAMAKIRGVDDGMCPLNPETLDYFRKRFEKCAGAGCGGLILLFDDLPRNVRNHHTRCPKCKVRFKSLAQWQLIFIKVMVDVAQKHGIKKMIVCPTPYSKNSYTGKEYADYFKIFCGPDFMKDVLVFHCDFYTSEVKKLGELGLTNYIWWNNGLWPSPSYYEGIYMGIPQLHHLWYGYEKTEEDPVAPIAEAMESLRNLGTVCSHVYPSPTGTFAGRAMGGCLGWNPRAAVDNQPVLRKALVGKLFGRGSWPHYEKWETNMKAWFAGFRLKSIFADIDKQRVHIKSARGAYDGLVKTAGSAKGIDAPWRILKPETAKRLAQMPRTMAQADKSLDTPAVRPPVKATRKTAEAKDVLLWLRMEAADGKILTDSSLQGLKMRFHGKKAVLMRGVEDNALFFNGVKNILDVPANKSAQLNPGRDSFSVECWVFMLGHGWNQFVGKRRSARDCYNGAGWALGSDRRGNMWRFTMEDTDGKRVTVTARQKEMLYNWHYLTVVRDRASGQILLYVDGKGRKKISDPTADVTVKDQPFCCGRDATAGGYLWGFLDEVRYVKRALTPAEIKARYETARQALSDLK